MFKLVPDLIAKLDGCDTPCEVRTYNGQLYANTGPLFRLMKPVGGDAYVDDQDRPWTITRVSSEA